MFILTSILFLQGSILFSEQVLAYEVKPNLRAIADRWAQDMCAENQIFLRQQVPADGCYNRSALFQHCFSNQQCIANAYCGFPENLTITEHQCICADGFAPSSDNSTCVPIHTCSVTHFNPDNEQADCPLDTEFCQYSLCLCRPSYRRTSDGDCVWNVPDRPEPTKSSNFNIPTSSWIAVLAIIAAVLLLLTLLMAGCFCCLCQKAPSKTTAVAASNAHKRSAKRSLSRQISESKYTLVVDKGAFN